MYVSSLSSAIPNQQYIHDRSWLWKLHDSLHKILVINFQRHTNPSVRRAFKFHAVSQCLTIVHLVPQLQSGEAGRVSGQFDGM